MIKSLNYWLSPTYVNSSVRVNPIEIVIDSRETLNIANALLRLNVRIDTDEGRNAVCLSYQWST